MTGSPVVSNTSANAISCIDAIGRLTAQMPTLFGEYIEMINARTYESRTLRLATGADNLETVIEFGAAPAPPRFGVPVAGRLDFGRGPAISREDDRPSGT